MDEEELAALRATQVAADNLPASRKSREERLAEIVGQGAELLPYVPAPSCSDPRDRRLSVEDLAQFRTVDLHQDATAPAADPLDPHEPPFARPSIIVSAILFVAALSLLLHLVLAIVVQR